MQLNDNQNCNVINETIDTGIWANNGIIPLTAVLKYMSLHKEESAKLLCYSSKEVKEESCKVYRNSVQTE